VLSGAMIKAGLLGWIRFLPLGEAAIPGCGFTLISAGLGAAFFGTLVGVAQRNPKTVLAYSSISQVGFMTAGVGLALIAAGAAVRGRRVRMTTLLWIVAVAMIVIGVVGTVLPALPGPVFVLGGIALAAWIDGFATISGFAVGVVAVLTVLAFAADYVAAMLGAKKAGASRLAIAGAAIGTVAGVLTGFVGLLFMPLVGAAIGEFIADRDMARAGKVGVATWIGLLLGTAVKVALVFTMVGIFVAALLL